MSTSAEVRANAARALTQIIKGGRTIDRVEHKEASLFTSPLVTELVYGTCRHYFSLSETIDLLLEKPFRDKDHDIYSLLLVGAYQLRNTRIKRHAIVNETVNACKTLNRGWARGLVNAILRKVSSENTEQSFEMPPWLQSALEEQYTESAELGAANLLRAPMCLRVNLKKTTVTAYQSLLDEHSIEYDALPNSAALRLHSPIPTRQLPGFEEGLVAIQDYGAQLVASLAAALCREGPSEPRILDACTAPGGKLFHLLEQKDVPIGEVVALENSESRAASARTLGQQLGHQQPIILGDATQLSWWDQRPFDFILLDAPCSGTGTLRRHPDIKLLLKSQDISAHTSTQQDLLHNLWSTLAPQGTLLYCTCSLLAAENDDVIGTFLASQPEHTAVVQDLNKALPLTTGQPTKFGWQLLPIDINTDGFYMAAITKMSAPTASNNLS